MVRMLGVLGGLLAQADVPFLLSEAKVALGQVDPTQQAEGDHTQPDARAAATVAVRAERCERGGVGDDAAQQERQQGGYLVQGDRLECGAAVARDR